MEELLANYSMSDILIFCIVLASAIKGIISFYDWAKGRLTQVFDEGYAEKEHDKEIESEIGELQQFLKEKKVVDDTFNDFKNQFKEMNNQLKEAIQTMNDKMDNADKQLDRRIDVLMESDKEAIKAYITEKHHYFCYDKGWIDDYNLECIMRRYEVYKEEHGNSFVSGLIEEIQDLPKQPPVDDHEIKGKYENTHQYVQQKKEVN